MADLTKLVPGGRLRMKDWRNGMIVDCTFIGFAAGTTMRIASGKVAKSGERFGRLELLPDVVTQRRLYLYVYRDGFCGDRGIAARDVVELLPTEPDADRVKRIVWAIAMESQRCDGCHASSQDLRVKHPCRIGCPGETLLPELMRMCPSLFETAFDVIMRTPSAS